ncbi:hypothetical protein Btru_005569 [Bulinus truncatus]|nr:hypothetical protein Btru_005569 [Bulinus truncatus]
MSSELVIQQKMGAETSGIFSACSQDSDCGDYLSCVHGSCRCPAMTYYDPVQHCLPDCYSTINETSGYIASPRDINFSKNVSYCTWTIKGRINSFITFNILSLDVRASTHCVNDYLELFDGLTSSDRSLGKQCGMSYSTSIVSASNFLFVVFQTHKVKNFGSFTARYSVHECNITRTDKSGVISSPGYPVRYFPNVYCSWHILVDPGMFIDISLSNITIESSALCEYDMVEVFDGHSTRSRSLGRFCGRTSSNMTTTSNSVFLVFRSDGMVEKSGFFGRYTAYDCNLTTTENFGHLTSPGYPGNYSDNLSCSMTIIGQIGTTISLSFNDLELDGCHQCSCDYIEIYDGASPRDPSLVRYCSTPTNVTRSTGNVLHLYFHTNSSGVHRGFNATFTVDGLPRGALCLSNYQCSVGVCFRGICDCPEHQFYNVLGAACVTKHSRTGQCYQTQECQDGLTCVEGHCDCTEGQVYDSTTASCQTRLHHGEECLSQTSDICSSKDLQCKADTSQTLRCLCKDDFIYTGQSCVPESLFKVTTLVTVSKSSYHADLHWSPINVLTDVSYRLTWTATGAPSANDTLEMSTNQTIARISDLRPGQEYEVKVHTVVAKQKFYNEKVVSTDHSVNTIPDVPGKLDKSSSSMSRVPYVLKFEPINGSAAYYELTLADNETSQTYRVTGPEVHINPTRMNVYYGYSIAAYNKRGESGRPLTGLVLITNTGDITWRGKPETSLDWKLIFTIGLGSFSFFISISLIGLVLLMRNQGKVFRKSHSEENISWKEPPENTTKEKINKSLPVVSRKVTSEHPYDLPMSRSELCETNVYTVPIDTAVLATKSNKAFQGNNVVKKESNKLHEEYSASYENNLV